MGRLTTHVLDTARGCPAAGVAIELARDGATLVRTRTNEDGRTDAPLLEGDALEAGAVRAAVRRRGVLRRPRRCPTRRSSAWCRCASPIADPQAHYHVPLLASPWAYSTYRGS